MMQFPLPLPGTPIDPPSAAIQLFSCLVVVLLTFETIVLFLPEEWRLRISELQFGPGWAAKRGGE